MNDEKKDVRAAKIRSGRCPIKSSDFQDVSITGFSVEKFQENAELFSAEKYAFYTINFIINGNGWATFNGKKVQLKPDMLYVVYPNSDATILSDPQNPYTLGWLNLDGTKIGKIFQRIGVSRENPIIQLQRDERLRKIFKQTPIRCKNNIEQSDLISLAAFYNIIDLILEQTATINVTASRSSVLTNMAAQYVKDNFHDVDLNVGRIASAVGVSPKHLSTIFKKETGTELRRYIANSRMTAATELLTQGKHSIQEIADLCGYASPYYFSLVYKKYNLVPPSQTKKDFKTEKKQAEELKAFAATSEKKRNKAKAKTASAKKTKNGKKTKKSENE